MPAAGFLTTLALAVLGQPQDPLPKPQTLDPYLPAQLMPVVRAAAEAELDPKRGSGNALELLREERKKWPTDKGGLTLDLRIAGVVLRTRFFGSTRFPEPIRWEQAISTFTRLDLAEPGLITWLERAVEHSPYAKKQLAKKSDHTLKAALLLRGEGFDRKKAEAAFQKPIAALGYELVFVPAKEATLILKLAAEDAVSDDKDQRAVRVLLGLESLKDGQVVWRQSLYRTEKAKDPAVALASALEWMTRIGGRDLFFRWLGEKAFPSLVEGLGPPSVDGHDHGPKTGAYPVHGQNESSKLEAEAVAPGQAVPKTK